MDFWLIGGGIVFISYIGIWDNSFPKWLDITMCVVTLPASALILFIGWLLTVGKEN